MLLSDRPVCLLSTNPSWPPSLWRRPGSTRWGGQGLHVTLTGVSVMLVKIWLPFGFKILSAKLFRPKPTKKLISWFHGVHELYKMWWPDHKIVRYPPCWSKLGTTYCKLIYWPILPSLLQIGHSPYPKESDHLTLVILQPVWTVTRERPRQIQHKYRNGKTQNRHQADCDDKWVIGEIEKDFA